MIGGNMAGSYSSENRKFIWLRRKLIHIRVLLVFAELVSYKPTGIAVQNIICRGPVVGMSFHLQGFLKYVNHRFVMVFFLYLLVLIGMVVTPVHAASNHAEVGTYASYRWNNSPPVVSGDTNSLTLLAQSELPVLSKDPLGEDQKPDTKKETVEPVTHKLPIWGQKVREMGFDLPLPFGAGANLVLMDQGIDIRNVKVGIGDPIFEIEDFGLSDAHTHDTAITMRLDMWLLPFANIYGIFGYINGQSELDLDIGSITGSIPIPGLPPIFEPGKTIDLNIHYNGTTFGGGMTLAGGYKDFFASVDGNYTYSNVDLVDGDITTLTISPRLGMLVDAPEIKGSLAFWVGAMYMKYKQTIRDDINLNKFDPRLPPVQIDYKLDVKNDEPWNFLFGGQWEITKRWQVMAEGGVGDRKQLILGAFFRF